MPKIYRWKILQISNVFFLVMLYFVFSLPCYNLPHFTLMVVIVQNANVRVVFHICGVFILHLNLTMKFNSLPLHSKFALSQGVLVACFHDVKNLKILFWSAKLIDASFHDDTFDFFDYIYNKYFNKHCLYQLVFYDLKGNIPEKSSLQIYRNALPDNFL